MDQINIEQPLFELLKEKIAEEKAGGKNLSILRVCNALLENKNLEGYRVMDVLGMTKDEFILLNRMGKRTYRVFCEMLWNVPERQKWTIFQGYAKPSAVIRRPPKVTVTPVTVPTDPETIVYQIDIDGEQGVWQDTANTAREVSFFLRGMQALNSFIGLTGFKVPPAPRD